MSEMSATPEIIQSRANQLVRVSATLCLGCTVIYIPEEHWNFQPLQVVGRIM